MNITQHTKKDSALFYKALQNFCCKTKDLIIIKNIFYLLTSAFKNDIILTVFTEY